MDLEPFVVPYEVALEILEVLRLDPIYILLHTEHKDELGDDFKPWKWEGYELEHAEKAIAAYKKLIALMVEQTEGA